jgi:predicted RNA methylase
VEIISSLVILAAVFFVALNEIFQQKMGVSPMPTVGRVRRAMIDAIPDGFAGDIYELGAGWGGITFAAARQFPQARIVAVEYSPLPYAVLWLRQRLGGVKNILPKRADFFTLDLSGAGVVLCYLTNPLMEKLEPKLASELAKGSVIISSTFQMKNWQPVQVIDTQGWWSTKIYIYRQEKNT